MSSAPSIAGTWQSLPTKLSSSTLDTLGTLGFSQMTPVQAGAIPLFLKNRDVVVEAVTGSGKTLAFVIPIIELLRRKEHKLKKHEVGAIIVSPTRELAKQIYEVLAVFLPETEETTATLKHALYIGGTTTLAQDRASFKERSPDIIVGTPGRLDELLRSGDVNVKHGVFEVLVLDEADRLLDMGFSTQLNSIILKLPKQRRTGLFSATMTDALTELVRAGLRYPVRVVVKVEDLKSKGEQRTPASLDIGYVVCDPDQKLAQMIRLITADPNKKFIVYFATCACVDYFYKVLSRLPQLKNISVHSLHGQMETKRREATFSKFVAIPSGQGALLLCTDVAARGLDVPDVDFVIQYDPPQDPKVFSHRCGRTARAGREGRAVVFLGRGGEEVYVNFLNIRKIPMRRLPYLFPNDKVVHMAEPTTEGIATERVEDPEALEIVELVRELNCQDRDVYEKGMKAFVSFVRSYSKHEATYIFRLKNLDLGKAAYGYGLLRLPKMPEISKSQTSEFVPSEIDVNTIKYADKLREKQRQESLRISQEKRNTESNSDKRNTRRPDKSSWSDKADAKQRKEERRLKKERKRDFLRREKLEAAEKGKRRREGDAPDGEDGNDEDEWEALQKEERLAKKVKKGKIGWAEFEKEVGGEGSQSEDGGGVSADSDDDF